MFLIIAVAKTLSVVEGEREKGRESEKGEHTLQGVLLAIALVSRTSFLKRGHFLTNYLLSFGNVLTRIPLRAQQHSASPHGASDYKSIEYNIFVLLYRNAGSISF